MPKQPTRSPADPHRKARFREIAREIVGADRHRRKYGMAVDTAGAIATALERAYREGLAAGRSPDRPSTVKPDAAEPLSWILIPPRPRTAFWSMCLSRFGFDMVDTGGRLKPASTDRGTPGWRIRRGDRDDDSVIADRSVAPLLRLGLVEPDPEHAGLRVSERGRLTWRLFLERGGRYPEDLTTP